MTAGGALGEALASQGSETPLADIERLALQAYDLTARAERLQSERDEIFRLATADRAFILKLTHPREDPLATDLQTQALTHVAREAPELPTPRLMLTREGQSCFRWGGPDGPAVQLTGWLPGIALAGAPRTSAQVRALGRGLARLGLALRDFRHPGDGRRLDWDLRHACSARPLLAEIDDPDRRRLAEDALDAFEATVAPRIDRLPCQVIHNDLNPHNVLVDVHDTDRITGLIDFGDVVRTARVHDVAIAASYLLGEPGDPLALAADLVGAYDEVSPLQPDEMALLHPLMAARLAVTVAITQWRARRNPARRAYITKNTGRAWAGLAQLAAAGPDVAAARLAGRKE